MRTRLARYPAVIVALLMLLVCAGAFGQTNTPTSTPTSTPTPTNTPSNTPTVTPTAILENPYAFWVGGRANKVIGVKPSGNRIYPLVGTTVVMGTATVQYIIPPWPDFQGALTLVSADGFSTTTGGNIALATYCEPGHAFPFSYDGATWYPVFVVGTAVPSHTLTSTPTNTPTRTPTITP